MKKFYTSEGKNRIITVLSSIVTMCLIILVSSLLKAENIVSAGTSLKVVSGTTLVSPEGLIIKSGATLDNAGTLILKKNLVNENASANSIGSGTVVFSGTVAQALNGPNVIQNLTINNAAGVTIGGENKVNGVLTLTSGLMTLGSNNLTLGTGATIAGAPSATAMLVPTGTGEVRKSFSGIGSFTFPVGDNTTVPEYSPVTLAFTAGAFGGGNYAGVKLVNAIYPGSPAVNYIKRYWDVSQSGITGFSCNSTFQYVPADVVGTENLVYCLRITPTTVVYFNAANTVLHQLTANSINTFGTFTGNQVLASKNLDLTLFLEGLYNGGGTMRKAQNITGDQFPGTTADQISVELHNSTSYATVYSTVNVDLSTLGASTAIIPGIHSGSYYLVIKHRNSIETWSKTPVALAGSGPVSYNFSSAAAQAYGNNMKALAGGLFAIYGGNATGSVDQKVDGSDMSVVDNGSTALLRGYVDADVTGDGKVDGSDMALVDNNSTALVARIKP